MPDQQLSSLGKYWEQSFSKELADDVRNRPLSLVDVHSKAGGFQNAIADNNRLDRYEKHGEGWIKKRISSDVPRDIRNKRFEQCEIRLVIEGVTFEGCHFVSCRFIANRWKEIKFSNCKFERCHFFNLHISGCDFVECRFELISISPESLSLESVSIAPLELVRALQPNIRDLPAGKDPVVESLLFASTRAKVVGALHQAVLQSGNLANSLDGYRAVVTCTLEASIAQKGLRYDKSKQADVARGRIAHIAYSLLDRMELVLINVTGWLTDWGKSLGRAILFMLCVFGFFSVVYYFASIEKAFNWDPARAANCLAMSFDISVVAGYTAHRKPDSSSFCLEAIKLVHLFLGVFWYSLVVSVASKRTMQ